MEAAEKKPKSSQLEQSFQSKLWPRVLLLGREREVPEPSPCSSSPLQKSVSVQCLHCVSDIVSSLLFFSSRRWRRGWLGPGEADSHWLLGSEN